MGGQPALGLPLSYAACVLSLQLAVGQVNVVKPAREILDLLLVLLLELLDAGVGLGCYGL